MTHETHSDDLRGALIKALGPSILRPFAGVTVRATRPMDDWTIDDLVFHTSEAEDVLATFLRPRDEHAPVPAVIYAHAHGSRYTVGRSELLEGRPSLQGPYAPDLKAAGIAALCLDMPCFGARQMPDESTRSKALLWRGDTLFGQMLGELRGGLDFLEAHPAVRSDHLGALGFSMGSTLAWWLAAIDSRVRAASALCSFADLETLIETGAHDGHGIYMMVPGLLEIARSGQIAGLTAPRALQICAGAKDWSTSPNAFDRGLADLEAAYAEAGARTQLSVHWEKDTGHIETPAMRAAVLAFLTGALQA